MQLIFATPSSALARWQTARVIQLLQAAQPGLECRELVIPTTGDAVNDYPINEIGTKSLFTSELEEAVLSAKAHAAVYSLKDLPVGPMPGMAVAAIPERGSALDALISANGQTLFDLPEGARIGTSSSRRAAQLMAQRPDFAILPLPGSVAARLRNGWDGEYDAIVLGEADLAHLGLQSHINQVLSLELMLPVPGQGALAVQCRADDAETLALLAAIHNPRIAAAVDAERAFLANLGDGSSLAVAAYAENDRGNIILTGAVFSPDGKQAIRLSAVDTEPDTLGERLAGFVLERGAAGLLKASV